MDFEYSNDLVIANGDIRLVTGLPEDAQRIKDRLSTFIGEWFLDIQFGPDYRKDVLKKNPNIQLISALLREEILKSVPGASIIGFTSSLSSTRVLSISYTVKTNNGIVADVIVIPTSTPPVIIVPPPPPSPSFIFSDFVVPWSALPVPGYQGFGATATGGITPFVVTSLLDSGPGTLRDALSQSGRYITFSVGGTISLTAPCYVLLDTTIDGFSAPSAVTITSTVDALILIGEPLSVTTRGSNIIVKGLRIRGTGGDGIQIFRNAHDIVIDHCDIAGYQDGAIDVTEGSFNITISWCLINHTVPGAPGTSLLNYDVGHISHHHNLLYGSPDRNPIVHGTLTRAYSAGPVHEDPIADISNNIVWNYSIGIYARSFNPSVATANVTNTLMKNDGVTTPGNTIVRSRGDAIIALANMYIKGNVSIHDCRGTVYSYGPDANYTRATMNDQNNQTVPFTAPPITGPSITDQQGRLNTWTAVKNGAGIIGSFPDDTDAAAARNAVIIPASSIFTQPWNDG